MTMLTPEFCGKLHRLLTRLILASPFLRDYSLSSDGLIVRAEFDTRIQSSSNIVDEELDERREVVH